MTYAPPINGVRCGDCRYFKPDAQNPTAAMGRCYHNARHGYFFAGEWHRCMDHTSEPQAKPETAKGE